MNKHHEKLLIASLAGMIIVGAAGIAAQPAIAAGYTVDGQAKVTGVAKWDHLNMRRWPASYSKLVGQLDPGVHVWVERCIDKVGAADWCLVERGEQKGWVNSTYLTFVPTGDI